MNAQLKPVEDFTISAVPPNMVDLVWPQCAPLVQRVIDKAPDDIVLDKVREECAKGDTLLTIVSRETTIIALNILNVVTLDTGKRVLTIPIIAGDKMPLWMERFMEVMKQIAKDYECTAIRGFAAREGWIKLLQPLGYKKLHTVLQYEIEE